jgi:hypothetical protein
MDLEEKTMLFTPIVMLLLLILLLIGIDRIDYSYRNSKYNDGIHMSDGGNWVYQQAVGHNHYTTYLYECDICGETLELENKR